MSFQDNENNIKELMSIFQVESEDILDRIFEGLMNLESTPSDKELTASLYRDMHSLKGAIRMVGFTNIQLIIHKIEDIFDKINQLDIVINSEKINVITKSIELVQRYLHESILNEREIIDDAFNSTVSMLEFMCDIELEELPVMDSFIDQSMLPISDLGTIETGENLSEHQEKINYYFNNSFEIIDSIVPEEESQEIVILKEEIGKIYDLIKDSNIYEVNTSLKNVLKKFVGDKTFYRMVMVVAVPIMIQNGITNFVSLLDNIMVGQVGTNQMSGVAIANQLIFVYNLCIFGGMSGAGIFGAQFFGQGSPCCHPPGR